MNAYEQPPVDNPAHAIGDALRQHLKALLDGGEERVGWRPERCDRIALVLQGGGALGAYQAGVYEALHEAEIEPDWVSGVSIGAINSAIIAGNRREHRLIADPITRSSAARPMRSSRPRISAIRKSSSGCAPSGTASPTAPFGITRPMAIFIARRATPPVR